MPVPILAFVGGALLLGNFVSSAMHFYPPLWTAWQKKAFETFPNVNPGIVELIEMLWRQEIDESEYFLKAAQFGYDEQVASKLYSISENLLSIADYITLWRREKITENEVDNLLHKMHISAEDMHRVKQATEYFPPAPDLIRFAVREVYSPEIVSRFQMMEDLPQKFVSEASKAGIQREHAEQYWAAHWDLPSANMGFEMLHRRIITEDDLKVLLRALDVMPFWRDALIKLSYNPLTRVDVRRMYGLGVLDEEGVYSSYLDIGYSPENAQRMTEFTVLYESDEYTGLTRSSIISAFKKDLIDAKQLKEFLIDFGYSEAVVEFWLTLAESEKESDQVDLIVDEVKAQYYAGQIDIDKARNMLSSYDLPASYITSVINELSVKRSAKVKQPTRSDLEKWLELQLINDRQYSHRMALLGYEPADIEMYLAQITEVVDTSEIKYMPLKTYERWVKARIITVNRFREVLTGMKKSPQDIEAAVREVTSAMRAESEV